MIWMWLAWAAAQDVPTEPVMEEVEAPAEAALAEVAPVEVTVWGEGAVRQARSTVIRSFEEQGWSHRRDRNGVAVFRPPKAWMGKAFLAYDGELTFRRPVVSLQTVQLEGPAPAEPLDPYFPRDPGGLAYPDGDGITYAAPHPAGTFWLLPSWDVVGPAHQRLRDQASEELDAYRDVVEQTRLRQL